MRSIGEIEAILTKRAASGYNSFWLAHEELYPVISMLVKGDLAYAYYIPGDRQAGYCSVGNVANLEGDWTIFRLDNQDQPILNDAVIRFSSALEIAKEFFRSRELPRCSEWLKL